MFVARLLHQGQPLKCWQTIRLGHPLREMEQQKLFSGCLLRTHSWPAIGFSSSLTRISETNDFGLPVFRKQPILLPRQAASSTEATEAAEAAASPSSSPSWGFVSNLHHTYTNYHRQNMTKRQGATPPTISKHLSTPNTQPFCFWGFSWSFKSLNGRHFLTLPGSQCHLCIVVRGQDVGHCCGHPSSRTIGRLVALLINRGRPFVAHLQSSGGFSQQDENVLHKWHQKPWLKCYNDVVGISSLDLQYESIWYMIYHDVSNLNLMYDMNLL